MAMTGTLMLRLMMAVSVAFWLTAIGCWCDMFTWRVPAATLIVGGGALLTLMRLLPSPDQLWHRRRNVCLELRIERRTLTERLAGARAYLVICERDAALPNLPTDVQAFVAERLAAARAEVSRLELRLELVETSMPSADAKFQSIGALVDDLSRQAEDCRLARLCARA